MSTTTTKTTKTTVISTPTTETTETTVTVVTTTVTTVNLQNNTKNTDMDGSIVIVNVPDTENLIKCIHCQKLVIPKYIREIGVGFCPLCRYET